MAPKLSTSKNRITAVSCTCVCVCVCVCVCAVLSHVQPFATAGTVAVQASLSMGFSMQEYWSWLPFPTPGDLLDPGIETASLVSPALAAKFFTTEPSGKPLCDAT